MKRNTQRHQSTDDMVTVVPTPIRPQVQQPTVNQAAIDLLESWRDGDEHEQRETWDYLKHALDEDRLSDRTLLP